MDRQVAARHVVVLLVRILVDHVVDQAAVDPASFPQRVALGRHPVGDDGVSRGLDRFQGIAEAGFDRLDPFGKSGIALQPIEPGLLLFSSEGLDRRRRRAIDSIRSAGEDPEATAMGAKPLDVEDRKTVPGGHALHRQKRDIAEMLVIDGVELDLLNQPQQVRKLHRQYPGRLQEQGQAGDEIVEIGNVGEHVVADKELGQSIDSLFVG